MKKQVVCFFVFACCLICTSNRTVWAKQNTIGEHFVGETLAYNVGFLWFDKAFSCVLNVQPGEKPGEYVATMWGKTQGFIGWVTSYRERLFVSYLEEVDNGRRFRTKHFSTKKIKGPKSSKAAHDFDYQNGRWRTSTYDNNRLTNQEERPLPGKPGFEDILSAFYNLRYGVYGPLEKGKSYDIPSFSNKEGLISCQVKVLTQKEQDKKDDTSQNYLANIQLDKEIFSTAKGIVWVWLSPQHVPLKGIAEDAIGFGDVYGNLKQDNQLKDSPVKFISPSLHYKALFPKGAP